MYPLPSFSKIRYNKDPQSLKGRGNKWTPNRQHGDLQKKLYQHRPQIAKTNFCVIKGTTSTPPKLVVPPPHSKLQRHPSMAPRPLPQSWSSPPCNGTTSTPPMAPRPLPQSWSSPFPPTIAHHNRTLAPRPPRQSWSSRPLPQSWSSPSPQPSHTTMAPCNGTTSTQPSHTTSNGTPKLVVTLPPTIQHTTMAPYEGTQQWHHVHCTLQWHHVHSTIAHYNGTLQRHPAMAPRPLNHSTLQWHPAMAHVHCTLQWHSGATSNAQKVVRRPPPLIGSKNPYSYRYLGNNQVLPSRNGGYLGVYGLLQVTLSPAPGLRSPICVQCHHHWLDRHSPPIPDPRDEVQRLKWWMKNNVLILIVP